MKDPSKQLPSYVSTTRTTTIDDDDCSLASDNDINRATTTATSSTIGRSSSNNNAGRTITRRDDALLLLDSNFNRDCWNDDSDDDIDNRSDSSSSCSSSNSKGNGNSNIADDQNSYMSLDNDQQGLPQPEDIEGKGNTVVDDTVDDDDEWTSSLSIGKKRSLSCLSSSTTTSNDCNKDNTHEICIHQVPLKYDDSVTDSHMTNDDNYDNYDVSFPPKKRHKTFPLLSFVNNKDAAALTSDPSLKTARRKKIQFHEMVDIISIPIHSEYSVEVKNQLWSSIQEIQTNAARNTIEFAHEGWNWETVLLEEQMFHCTVTNQYIHPVHCRNSSNSNNNQHQQQYHSHLIPS